MRLSARLSKISEFFNELKNSDIENCYIRQLEQEPLEEIYDYRSGILTMMKDYLAKLGWKIETILKKQ